MKRLLALVLVALILTGCGSGDPSLSEPKETTEATDPISTGIYVPGSAIETQTNGAVYQYEPAGSKQQAVTFLGDSLLLITEDVRSELCLYDRSDWTLSRQVQIETNLAETSWITTDNGLLYYVPESRHVVILNSALLEIKRISLSEQIQGFPVFAPDGSEIFYCNDSEIRGLDTATGIDRLIRSHSCTSQKIQGTWLGGTVLCATLVLEDGTTEVIYLSTETGSTLTSASGISRLETYADTFYAEQQDGIVTRHLAGTTQGSTFCLELSGQPEPALEIGYIMATAYSDGVLSLDAHRITDGSLAASVSITVPAIPVDYCSDPQGNCLWILLDDGILLSWKPEASPVGSESSYTAPVYSVDNPDTAGLTQVQSRVDALNKAHGIAICIWQDAVKTTGNYTLEAEYQVAAITEVLDRIEPVLDQFPDNFLSKSTSSRIRICIVRSIDKQVQAVHFWDDSDAFIVLSCGADLENDLLQALGYIIDVHILGNSPMADNWGQLNPEGFEYGTTESYPDAFTDPAAMVSVTDDRAHIFWYAITPDHAEMFTSEILQAKLLLLCQSIRDAWRLEKKAETFIWEQYLTEPIAYVK